MLESAVLSHEKLGALFTLLTGQGYEVIGPCVRDEVIVYEPILDASALPWGWRDKQDAGRYRLRQSGAPHGFAFAASPQSWKRYLHPARRMLWQGDKRNASFTAAAAPTPDKRHAFFGVRACDLAAIAVQDRVLIEGAYSDEYYAAVRRQALIIAVNCSHPSATCFCQSMETGPACAKGFDLCLTEIVDEGGHRFLIEAGSAKGQALCDRLPLARLEEADKAAARRVTESAAANMVRALDTRDLPARLIAQPEHPRWQEVAARCLACANCTMVCPTCFCTDVADKTDITGNHAARWQLWASCFTLDFSHAAGGPVRASTPARYRQWLTHKLATWHEQFGTSGCVGCGRCIAWCPAGIDLTEEAAAIAGDFR
ncbi:MAG: 4Fe-4S dicluster domain-containing protein [Pseudomonadota bacterium]